MSFLCFRLEQADQDFCDTFRSIQPSLGVLAQCLHESCDVELPFRLFEFQKCTFVIKTVRIACTKICLLRVRDRRRFARGLGGALFAWALNSEVPNWVASHSSEQRQDVVAFPIYAPTGHRAQTVQM